MKTGAEIFTSCFICANVFPFAHKFIASIMDLIGMLKLLNQELVLMDRVVSYLLHFEFLQFQVIPSEVRLDKFSFIMKLQCIHNWLS